MSEMPQSFVAALSVRARAGLEKIAPYKPGEAKIQGIDKVIKLSSNEGPFGPPPSAIQAMRDCATLMHRYPETQKPLIAALAAKYHINPEQILCGAGSDELITLLLRTYTGAGDKIVYSAYGFLMYKISAMANGVEPVSVAEKVSDNCLVADPQALVEAVCERTKILFLANPNNPTGSVLKRGDLEFIAQNLPPHCLFVIDAAYAEYMDDDDYSDGLDLVQKYPNVVMLRTFSKIYALGGLRLGWMVAHPEIIDMVQRVRNPFNVSAMAIAAGIAALDDEAFLQQSRTHNRMWLEKFATFLKQQKFKPYESHCNFILCDFETPARCQSMDQHLRKHGILVRPVAAYGLTSSLRISIGTAQEMDLLMNVMRDFK